MAPRHYPPSFEDEGEQLIEEAKRALELQKLKREIRELKEINENMGPQEDFDWESPRDEEEQIRQEAIREELANDALTRLREMTERANRERERQEEINRRCNIERNSVYDHLLKKLKAEKKEEKVVKASLPKIKTFECPRCKRQTTISVDPYYADDDNQELIQETWCRHCEIEIYFHYKLTYRTNENINQ